MAVVALVVSALAFVLSVVVAAVQRRRANMEIARSLHVDLTSGVVAESRRPLGEVAFAARERSDAGATASEVGTALHGTVDLEEVRHHYFVLLWCFERVWHGREVVTADTVFGRGQGEAFDDMFRWHVHNWSRDLPVIKCLLDASDLGRVRDGDSAAAFADLGRGVLDDAARRTAKADMPWELLPHFERVETTLSPSR